MTTGHSLTVTSRLGSMLLDHIIMSFFSAALGLVVFGVTFVFMGRADSFQYAIDAIYPWVVGAAILVYFNKDWFGGRSLAKRITGQEVVQVSSGRSADQFRCFVRNLTILVWPLEVLVTLLSPSRRLGDWLAGTQVVPFRPHA
jgi:uncharacterized RDD family membrane protein YckC